MSATIVTLERGQDGLDFFIKGGREHGIPIIITQVLPGGRADQTGVLGVGTQILAVNGTSLAGASHAAAVAALNAAGARVTLHVRENNLIKRALEDQAATAAITDGALNSCSADGSRAGSIRPGEDTAGEEGLMLHPEEEEVEAGQSEEEEEEGYVVQESERQQPLAVAASRRSLPALPALQLQPSSVRQSRISGTLSSRSSVGNDYEVANISGDAVKQPLAIKAAGPAVTPPVGSHIVPAGGCETAVVAFVPPTYNDGSGSNGKSVIERVRVDIDSLRLQAEATRRKDLAQTISQQQQQRQLAKPARTISASSIDVRPLSPGPRLGDGRQLDDALNSSNLRRDYSCDVSSSQDHRAPLTSRQRQPTAPPPLPEGWIERVDGKTGRTFYAKLAGCCVAYHAPSSPPSFHPLPR